jgi:hypothetical protein
MLGKHQPADDERRLLRRETDIARIPSPIIRQIHEYWLSKRGDRTLPSWSDIDPAEIVRLLPNIIVVAVEYDPRRIFFRLVGTQIAEFRGDVTGYHVDSVPWNMPATRASVQESYEIAIDSRAPIFTEAEIRTIHDTYRRIFSGIWPLAPEPGAPVDRCIAAEDYGTLTRADLR